MPKAKQETAPAAAIPSAPITGTEPAAIPPAPTAPALPAGVTDFEDFNKGEMFGGSFPQLALDENQVSPLLEYVKDTKIPVTDNDGAVSMKTAPVVKIAGEVGGVLYSLPIGSIFQKHWKEASPAIGDTLAVKRYTDATKKRGAGAGGKMKVFAVKIYTRKVIAPAASE